MGKPKKRSNSKWTKPQDPDTSAQDLLSQTACTIETTSLFSDDSDSDTEFEYLANPNIKVRTNSFARDQSEEGKTGADPKSGKETNSNQRGGNSILGLLRKRIAKPPQGATLNQDEEPIC